MCCAVWLDVQARSMQRDCVCESMQVYHDHRERGRESMIQHIGTELHFIQLQVQLYRGYDTARRDLYFFGLCMLLGIPNCLALAAAQSRERSSGPPFPFIIISTGIPRCLLLDAHRSSNIDVSCEN